MIVTLEPVFNYRNRTNKNGLYSIHLRVTIYRVSKYYKIETPSKLRPEQWVGKPDAWVGNSHEFAFEINNRIIEKKTRITDVMKRFYLLNRPVTFYAIDRELKYKGDRILLNDYFDNFIKRPPDNLNLDPVTWEKYSAFLKHLNSFQSKIYFSEINADFIARVKTYLTGLKGRNGKLASATIKSYFDKFKVVLSYAAKKELLLDYKEVQAYFEEVRITIPKRKEGLHIEIEEVRQLRNLNFSPKELNLRRDRDLFLFQVYTGFYYKDLQVLRKDQLFNDMLLGSYIISERDKNDKPTIIPLFKFPYAKEIIAHYRDNSDDFPFLFRKDCFIEVQVYNRNLKTLAKRACIERKLSNKTARHTNAQLWIRFGADRPVLSKMLGHEKEETTGNYYRVNIREVIEGTKSIDFNEMGI